MIIDSILLEAGKYNVSDVHLSVGRPPMMRLNGELVSMETFEVLEPSDMEDITMEILTEEQKETLFTQGDVDFVYTIEEGQRYRFNAYMERENYALAIRLLSTSIPTMEQLNLPPALYDMADKPRGLVLITGPTGSGKSTTLASMIDHINTVRRSHIITLEDPIEYIHYHKNSIIHQREVGADTTDYQRALRGALRQDPDVILLGEMRDYETMQAAITAAETGHLVFSTVHTKGAANTIDRIIDSFPADQQQQVRIQLASVLEGVVTQNLVKKADNSGRALVMEILVMTDAVRSMIRDAKTYQILSTLQTGIALGMQSMDYHLAQLVKQGVIDQEEALSQAMKQEDVMRYIKS